MFNRRILFVAATVAALAGCATHSTTVSVADFAARQKQIAYALKTLSVMGLKGLGAIYGTAHDHTAYHAELERIAAGMQLKLESFQGTGCGFRISFNPQRRSSTYVTQSMMTIDGRLIG